MSAHLRSVSFDCQWPGCGKKATVQLYSTFNDPMARYCRTHGERALKEQQARDEAYYRSR